MGSGQSLPGVRRAVSRSSSFVPAISLRMTLLNWFCRCGFTWLLTLFTFCICHWSVLCIVAVASPFAVFLQLVTGSWRPMSPVDSPRSSVGGSPLSNRSGNLLSSCVFLAWSVFTFAVLVKRRCCRVLVSGSVQAGSSDRSTSPGSSSPGRASPLGAFAGNLSSCVLPSCNVFADVFSAITARNGFASH